MFNNNEHMGIINIFSEATDKKAKMVYETRKEKDYLTAKEVAAELHKDISTIKRWRKNNPPKGPPFMMVGKSPQYPIASFNAWLAKNFHSDS